MSGAVPPEAWPPSMQHLIGSTRNGIAGRNMGLCCTFGLMAELQSPGTAIHQDCPWSSQGPRCGRHRETAPKHHQGQCCDSKRWTQLHTTSPPLTPSVRVDVKLRAPSECQFCHWRAWTQRLWSLPQIQVCSPPETAQPGLRSCVVAVTTSQCSKGEGCCIVATRPEM